MDKNEKNIYLSYSHNDTFIVNKIADELSKNNIHISNKFEKYLTGEEISSYLTNSISSSDYMVIFISSNYSKWQDYETYIAFEEYLSKRDITIIPVLLDKVSLPESLNNFLYIDLTQNFENGLNVLVSQLKNTSKVDFSILSYKQFEDLVSELLSDIGFFNIKRNMRFNDIGTDIVCEYRNIDPFGNIQNDTWIVEVKLYKSSRLDIKTILQVKNQLLNNASFDKALIVTNGYLTSASKQTLDLIKGKEKIDIKVIEGSELKRLLIKKDALINKYFIMGR